MVSERLKRIYSSSEGLRPQAIVAGGGRPTPGRLVPLDSAGTIDT
jgi:hypothetical protein